MQKQSGNIFKVVYCIFNVSSLLLTFLMVQHREKRYIECNIKITKVQVLIDAPYIMRFTGSIANAYQKSVCELTYMRE